MSHGYCSEHQVEIQKPYASIKLEKTAEHGYGEKWRKARAAYLRQHPLCVQCEKQGRMVQATVVDHVIPHKKDWSLFWDSDNWQALCARCHDSKTARETRR